MVSEKEPTNNHDMPTKHYDPIKILTYNFRVPSAVHSSSWGTIIVLTQLFPLIDSIF